MIEITNDKNCPILIVENIRCVIQSYKADDFVNLSPIQTGKESLKNSLSNIHIDFVNKKISTSGKANAGWKQLVSKLDCDKVNSFLNVKMKELKRDKTK